MYVRAHCNSNLHINNSADAHNFKAHVLHCSLHCLYITCFQFKVPGQCCHLAPDLLLTFVVMDHACSQSRASTSTSNLISSATAMVGWVSFSWKQALSGNSFQLSPCLALKRAITSYRQTSSGTSSKMQAVPVTGTALTQ
eukprot:GHRR01035620.1.p1 GENE.GHRR01035620.1~~GHRR01035620.1.p1  ORF type:complete len:140 (+),score=22.63 GHRR01035620.1:393-812(+)